MAPNTRKGGVISFQIDGESFQAKGVFTHNINPFKRETIVGADDIHGFKEEPKVQFIEGIVTDNSELDAQAMLQIRDAVVTLELANGKTVVIRQAVQVGDGDTTSDEGEIPVRFEGKGEEIRP